MIDLTQFDDEEFVFKPDAWDLAMVIGLVPDPETDRDALAELADAALAWAEGPEVDAITEKAARAIWSDELRDMIREGLVRVAGHGDEWTPVAEEALVTFDHDPMGSPVTRAVVRHLAMRLGELDTPVFFCLCCIDEAVKAAAPGDRRQRALQIAPVARRDAAVGADEIPLALAGVASPPINRLATDARRTAVRARFGRLGRIGRDSIPALASELRAIAEEPLPVNPQDDDVWCAVATVILADVVRPELN